jgi:iron complex outermembrane recepter protein
VGAYRDREGYTHDYQWNKDRDDTHWYSGRLTLSWKPTDRLSNDFLLYGATSETNGTGLIHRGFNIPALQGVGFCVDPPLTPPGPSGIAVNCSVYRDVTADADRLGPRGTRNSVDAFQTTETWGVINTTNYELNDNLTLRNIVSYQRFSSSYAYDGDGSLIQQYEVDPIRLPPGYLNESPVHLPRDDLRGVTEELQLQGSYFEDKLVFAAGGFYYNQEPDGLQGASQISYCPAAFTGFCPPQQSYGGVSNKSTALYAQATVDLGLATQALDGVRLTGGYRYTWDEIDGTSLAFTPQAGGTVICTNTNLVTVNPEECRFSGHLESKAPTWTFGLDYRIRPELLVFGKVSRGYKAGGFNPYAVRPETRTFNPEKVTSYEIGFKSDFRIADMPTRLNASVYKLDYTNIQRATGDFNPVTSASGAQILAAEATIKGLELDATIRPFDWLEIGGNYSRTDGEYDKFNYTALVPTVACNGPVAAGGIADASCVPMQYVAPEIWSIHASVDLPIPEDMGTLSFFVNYSQTADQHTEALVLEQFQPGERIESFGLLNASLDWKGIAGSNVDLSLFVSNATDETYRISNTDVFQSGSLLSWATIYGEPRMYGVRLRYNFGS